MKSAWIAAWLVGVGGGFLLGRVLAAGTRLPETAAVLAQGSSSPGSKDWVAMNPPDDGSGCAPPVAEALASLPYWTSPGPICWVPQAPGGSSSEKATAPAAEGPSDPVCSPAMHQDYFLVRSDEGQLLRIQKALNPFGFGYYRGQMPSPMGDHSMINGIPMRVAQMHVSEPPDAVLAHYVQQLALNDIYPLPRLLQGESGPLSLTFQFGADDENVLVLVPIADGTMVLTAVGAKMKKLPGQTQLPASFPHPPDVENVSVDAVSEGKSFQRDMMFSAALDLEHLRSFYEHALASQGFLPEPVSVDKPQRWQQGFFRNGEVINLSAHADSSARSTVNVIWVTHPLSGDEP
jgi:hypothetical protein